ncbi:hypothetical protein SOVF_090430 [Spinacia oleracea]|nr:hypothetical protein SOVF_090430 [Spinacia oleracea]
MDSGRFSADQQSNEQVKPPEPCWCRGVSNLGEMNWLQDFMLHQLKPSIGEEVEKVLDRKLVPIFSLLQDLQQYVLFPPNLSSLPHQAEPSASRILQLKFKGDVPDTLLTMTKIKDHEGASLEVELLDESGNRVEDGPESCMKIRIDVLDGDFDVEKKEDDYTKNIAKPRNTKGALLKEKCEIAMSGGVVCVSHFSFTDNSASMRNKTFKLGATVIKGLPPGVIVKAAVSGEIRVKERRLKRERKHKTPSAEDELWRLVNIRKNGPVHERALKAGICTVQDFLKRYHTNPKELQLILDVPEANWNEIVKNAEACKLTNECYRYYDVASGDDLQLDCAFNIVSVTFKGQINQPYEDLSDYQKELADELRRTAYEKRNDLAKTNAPWHPANHSIVQRQEPPPPPQPQPPSGELAKTNAPTNQIYGKEQEQPLPCGNSNIGGPFYTQDAGSLLSYQMTSIPPTNICHYATAENQTYQVKLVDHPYLPTPISDPFTVGDGLQLEASSEDSNWDMEQLFRDLMRSSPRLEERGNVTSKLIAACYVTKAAALFMISVQQDASVPAKKRKLQ